MIDHKTGTREEWLAAQRAARCGEGAHATRRRTGAAATGAALGADRGRSTASRPTKAPRPSTISSEGARSSLIPLFGPVHRRVSVMLGDRGRLRRLSRASRTSRRRVPRRSRGLARETAGVQATDGLDLPWASSFESDFNYDFGVAFTEEQQQAEVVEYGFRAMDTRTEIDDEATLAVYGTDLAGLPGGAWYERVRARGRRRLPHLLGVHAGLMASGPCIRGSTARHRGATRRS